MRSFFFLSEDFYSAPCKSILRLVT